MLLSKWASSLSSCTSFAYQPYFRNKIFHLCNHVIWSDIWMLYVRSWMFHWESSTWQACSLTTKPFARAKSLTLSVFFSVSLLWFLIRSAYCESFTVNWYSQAFQLHFVRLSIYNSSQHLNRKWSTVSEILRFTEFVKEIFFRLATQWG